MHVVDKTGMPALIVINEVKYFVAFTVLKRLLEQKKISIELFQHANVAIAKKYGVLQYYI